MEHASLLLNVLKKVALHLAPVLEGRFGKIFFKEYSKKAFFTKSFCLPTIFISRFGVCCVFMTSTCGAAISVNCSYIKNPGFPSAFTSTSSCSYTINKCDSCKKPFKNYNNLYLQCVIGSEKSFIIM